MSDLGKTLRILLWALAPLFITPYTIKNNKAQTNRIQKWISIFLLNLTAIYFSYNFIYELKPPNLSKNPFLFIGYMRSVMFSIMILIFSLIISKNHEKVVLCTTRLLDLARRLNAPLEKFKLILIWEILFLYSGAVFIFITNFLRYKDHPFTIITHTYVATITFLGSMVAESYFMNLIMGLYFCTDVVHKKLEEFGKSNAILPIPKDP